MYIYGRKPVLEALNAGSSIEKIFIRFGLTDNILTAIRTAAKQRGIPCVTADKRKFPALEREACPPDSSSQGVIAVTPPFATLSVEDLIAIAYRKADTPLLVALDGITDPHNLGAIARSAECAGAHGLILPERNAAHVSGVAMKTAAGAFEHLRVAKTGNLATALTDAHNAGFRIVGTAEEAESMYTALDCTEPLVLVIGSEGRGMHPAVRKVCSDFVSIPLAGKISSLNASVAAGVVLFEIKRRRDAAAHSA